jgi:hypothetical protein
MPMTTLATMKGVTLTPVSPLMVPGRASPTAIAAYPVKQAAITAAFAAATATPGVALRELLAQAVATRPDGSPVELANDLAMIIEGYVSAVLTLPLTQLDTLFTAHTHLNGNWGSPTTPPVI